MTPRKFEGFDYVFASFAMPFLALMCVVVLPLYLVGRLWAWLFPRTFAGLFGAAPEGK